MNDHELKPRPMLSSPQNERVKEYVELREDGNVRRHKERFLLEGKRAVATALSLPHVVVHEVIYSDHLLGPDVEVLRQAEAKQIQLVRVSRDVFRKIADVRTPQGIAAVVRLPDWNAEEVLARPEAVFVVACGVQDPGNVGTLIRSCEAAGATGLISLEGTADAFNAKVVRSTAGLLLALPILRFKTAEFLQAAEQRHIRLIATAAGGGQPYRQFDWKTRPLALCIGNEGEGLPAAVESACREKVTIPLKGQAESLNAAIAASVLLFEALYTPDRPSA